MKKCILVSFFNSKNIGDVLITEELVKLAINTGYDVKKCSYEGDFNIKGYEDIHRSDAIKINKLFARVKLFSRLNAKYRQLKFWREFEDEVEKCDVFVIGGGNMIFDLTAKGKSAVYFNRYIDIAKKHNKLVWVISIGIGPFQTNDQYMMTISTLNRCDYITFRDYQSFNLITHNNPNKHKYFLTVDPVFMLPTIEKSAKQNELGTVGIGVINTLLFNTKLSYYQSVLLGYVQIINRFVAEGREVLVFSTEKNDYCMVDDVVNACKNVRVKRVNISTSEDLMDLYTNKISLLIAARMHSLIVAYTQLVPVIGISWQKKVDAFFEIIGEEKSVFPMDNISLCQNEIIMLARLKELELEDYQRKAKEKLEELRRQYEINKTILSGINIDKNDYILSKL